MRNISVLLLCLLFAVIGACKKNATQPPANTSSGTAETSTTSASPAQAGSPSADQAATAVKPKVDACAMLTTTEIDTVQGEAIKETKLSRQAGGGLPISQCFFTRPSFSNSISLLIAQ